MKSHTLKRLLSLFLSVVLICGLLPVQVFATHDNDTGRPTDLNNPVYLSILTADDGKSLPGEPSGQSPGNYTGISPTFTEADGVFASTAEGILKPEILDIITEGTADAYNDHIWGYFELAKVKDYFVDNVSFLTAENEAKIIRAIKNLDESVTTQTVLSQYEIVWYVIKYQNQNWLGQLLGNVDGWHIDGVIRERTAQTKYAINYHGNGSTNGAVPNGVQDIGDEYTILDPTVSPYYLEKQDHNFLHWNTAPDGSGTVFAPGDPIRTDDYPTDTYSMTLYAQWAHDGKYPGTVNTYLNGYKKDISDIHGYDVALFLKSGETEYSLEHSNVGVYTAPDLPNGTYYLYHKEGGTEHKINCDPIVINDSPHGINVHHYTVAYDLNGGTLATAPSAQNLLAGTEVTNFPVPARSDGSTQYRFVGWKDLNSTTNAVYQSGDTLTVGQNLAEPTDPAAPRGHQLQAQWEAIPTHTATVNIYLDNVPRDISYIHGDGVTLFLRGINGDYPMSHTGTGVYTATHLSNGTYTLYHMHTANGEEDPVGSYSIVIDDGNASMDVHHYSVTYNANGGSFSGTVPGTQILFGDTPVTVLADPPIRSGYYFTGWKDLDETIYQPGQTLTAGIKRQHRLIAQWAKAVDVTVTLNVNPVSAEGDVDDVTARDARLVLTHKLPGLSSYTEVADTSTVVSTPVPTPTGGTTFSGLAKFSSLNPSSNYSANVFMHNYSAVSRSESVDDDGNYHVIVNLQYDPLGFDLAFKVVVDESVPDEHIPQALDLKVSYWVADSGQWTYIDEHNSSVPGSNSSVDVLIGTTDGTPTPRTGQETYHVWGFQTETRPYHYRVEPINIDYNATVDFTVSESLSNPNVVYNAPPYVATVSVSGGAVPSGTSLPGAYATKSGSTISQNGTITVTLSMNDYSVTFDANGTSTDPSEGAVNGQAKQTESGLYQIPDLTNYAPTRTNPNYHFTGWYYDTNGNGTLESGEITDGNRAQSGQWLTKDVTLIAHWKEPLTIQGTITIEGTYQQDGHTITILEADRPATVEVRLQEVDKYGTILSDHMDFSYTGTPLAASDTYQFVVPNDGRQYRILVTTQNFTTTYDNNADSVFTGEVQKEYTALFNGGNTAVVNAKMSFTPETFLQQVNIDVTQLSEIYRPTQVIVDLRSRLQGSSGEYTRITQHNVPPYGIPITITGGTGTGEEEVWKTRFTNLSYFYTANGYKLFGASGNPYFSTDGSVYNSSTAPFAFSCSADTYWDSDENRPIGGKDNSGILTLSLVPKTYTVFFDLNLPSGVTSATGMESFHRVINGNVVHATDYTWSYGASVTATPSCEGYIFDGWTEGSEVYSADGTFSIAPGAQGNLVLRARWKAIPKYTVHYLQTDSDIVLAPAKTVTTSYDAVLRETDLDFSISGYAKESAVIVSDGGASTPFPSELTITEAETTIILYYTPLRVVTVEHYASGEGIKIAADTHVEIDGLKDIKVGTSIHTNTLAISIDGFEFQPVTPDSFTVSENPANNVIKLYYQRQSYQYTVNYCYCDNGVPVDSKTDTFSADFGDIVTFTPPLDVTSNLPVVKIGGVNYALDSYTGSPLTIGSGSNKINVCYEKDAIDDADHLGTGIDVGDGIPDKYQAVITYKIESGVWAGSGTNANILELFDLYSWNEDEHKWVIITPAPKLGILPTGISTSHSDAGHWVESITMDTPVTESKTYTFTFQTPHEYLIFLRVINGKLTVNGDHQDTNEYYYTVQHDGDTTEYYFTPLEKYVLDQVVVNGTPTPSYPLSGSLDHDENHRIVVEYAKDEKGDEEDGGPDGIPDKYQKQITFQVVGGKWNDGTTDPIVKWVTLTDGNIPSTPSVGGYAALSGPEVGNNPSLGHLNSGRWDTVSGALPATLSGTNPVTFTYTYDREAFSLDLSVVNGITDPASPATSFLYDPGFSEELKFSAIENHVLDRVVINGNTLVTPKADADTSFYYTYNHVQDWTMQVIFKEDKLGKATDPEHGGDGTADEYQKKVIFRIENGTWDGTSDADKTQYVTLFDNNGTPVHNGQATVSLPSGMRANPNHQSIGTWYYNGSSLLENTTSVAVNRTTPDVPDIYVYRYEPSVVATHFLPYYVEHYQQQSDGSDALHEKIGYFLEYKTVDNIVDPNSIVDSSTSAPVSVGDKISAIPRNYGIPYSHDGTVPQSTVGANTSTVFLSAPVMQLYYTRAQYELQYDLNGGVPSIGNTYDPVTGIYHGASVTLKPAPVRTGYTFKGWKIDSNLHGANTLLTMAGNATATAQWAVRDDLSYTVNYREVGSNALIETAPSKTVTGRSFGAEITSESEKIDIAHYDYHHASATSITLGMDYNVLNLFYTKKSYAYSVEYYYNNVKDDSKTEVGTAHYGNTISSYVDKPVIGYVFDRVEPIAKITDVASNNVVKVHYKPIPVATVTFRVENGTWSGGGSDPIVVSIPLTNGKGTLIPALVPTGMAANSGYGPSGSWDTVPNTSANGITASVTYTYSFPLQGGAGGGGSTPAPSGTGSATLTKVDSLNPTVVLPNAQFALYLEDGTKIGTYTTDASGVISVSDLADGDYYWLEVRAPGGYTLDNSQHPFTISDGEAAALTVTNQMTPVPGAFSGDHNVYVFGYPDGTVRPESHITRAEVAAIFYRLLSDETRARYTTSANPFHDVEEGMWFNTAVSTMAAMGVVSGYPDGSFHPDANITRAEFAAMSSKFDANGNDYGVSFDDIYEHWAQKAINIAANNGWVLGYEDGTFKPNQLITRAEAMTMFNRVLQRVPESEADLLPGMRRWVDNADPGRWYYLSVQEATNSHDYERKVNGYERWTELTD